MTLTRRGRLLVTVATTAALVGGGAYALDSTLLSDGCTVSLADGGVDLSRETAMRATTAAARAETQGLDAQQTAEALSAVLGDAERTAAMAVALRALDGPNPALTCTVPASGGTQPQEEGPAGLTPRAETLRTEMSAVFGDQPLGGFAPGGVRSGHIEGSAHYEGRAVDVFFRPVSEENRRRGWVLAHWLVAHAERLDVAVVIFDDRIWSARRSAQGWRDYVHPSGDRDNEILRHLDHVHVDVR